MRLDRGSAEHLVDAANLVVHLVTLRPGAVPGPFHRHRFAQNTYLALEGTVAVLLQGRDEQLNERDGIFVAVGEPHATHNPTTSEARLLAIYDRSVADDFDIVPRRVPGSAPVSTRADRGVIVSRDRTRPSRPLRYERGDVSDVVTTASGSRLDIQIVTIMPDRRPGPHHYHRAATDFYLVLEGAIDLSAGGDRLHLDVGDAAIIPPGLVHGTTSTSPAPTRLIEIYAPGGPDFVEVDRAAEVNPNDR